MRHHFTILLVVLAGALAACASTPPTPRGAVATDRPVDSALALLTFDSAWSRIASTHYDTAFNGVDWPGVRDELRPHAATAGTITALRSVLEDMLSRLGESHFGVIPQEATDMLASDGVSAASFTGTAGLDVRLVDDELLVWRVEPGSGAAQAGIRTGWSLQSIDGRALQPAIDALNDLPEAERRTALTRMLMVANARLGGEVGSALTLRFRDEAGMPVDHTVTLDKARGEVVQFGNLPPVLASLEHDVLQVQGGCVGVIRLNYWMATLGRAFDAAVDRMRDCSGVIIDVRGNPGGVAGMVMGTAGHFLNDTLVLGHMVSRTSSMRLKANPRRVRADGSAVVPFSGPLAILTDEMSASTSEFFAAGLQGVGRARVFGTPTAGQALPALMVRLPTGDVLLHVIANFTGPNNVRIEGQGVLPDVRVALTRQDLLAGVDAPFSAALDWITGGAAAGHPNPGGSYR